MSPLRLHDQFFESTRGRIVALLRRRAATVDELASALGLTLNAVRVHLASMERDGLVRRGGQRRGATRPSHLYELMPGVDVLLSHAYLPLLTGLVRVIAEREAPDDFDALMRAAGRELAHQLPARIPDGPAAERVAAASRLLNRELGALTEVQPPGDHYTIQGHGCPLAALTGKHASACHAIESLLVEALGVPVHECCDRSGAPRCCFHVHLPPERGTSAETAGTRG